MNTLYSRSIALPLVGLLAGIGMSATQGCDNDLAAQCGLSCDSEAFINGQASISGVASIDAFFGAALDLDATMRGVSGELRAELDAIGASVGLSPGASGAELSAAIDAHLGLYVDGGLTIDYQPPRCQASVEATLSAAAECDVEADPGQLTVSCSGSCAAEAGVEVDCGAEATLMCEGTAPNLECSGTCSGSCVADLTAAASCDGTCRGTCEAGGSTMDGFEGRCNGMCTGECAVDVSAGASCSGRCEGSCEYTAPEGGCEASATAHCEANAGASIECDAGCEGTAEPPQVSAECEASVDAKASASLECTPPTLAFGFQFNGAAQGDLQAQAEFRAWLEGFRGHFGAILALRARGEVVAEAAGNLAAAASGAVQGAVDDLSASGDLKASVGAACALGQLPAAADALASSSGALAGNLTASAEVVAAFGG
ncbi:MAG: hypothetical protein KDK70_01045 [Myxococcales bacterium]|nr:hypothetical protein [Myxococcales bacterium]